MQEVTLGCSMPLRTTVFLQHFVHNVGTSWTQAIGTRFYHPIDLANTRTSFEGAEQRTCEGLPGCQTSRKQFWSTASTGDIGTNDFKAVATLEATGAAW